jgi:hypothetical protein
MKTPVVALVAIVVSGLVISLAAQQPPTRATSSLVGTWTLVSDERLGAAGPSRIPNPRGLLVFDAAGHALEVATRGGRPAYAAAQPTPAEAHVAFDHYSGFWGGYRVNDQRTEITYRADGAVNPNLMGQDLVRSYAIAKDRLTITSMPGNARDDGGERRRVWERVPPVENLSPTYKQAVGFWRHVVEKRVNPTTGAVISQSERAPSVIAYTPAGYIGVHFVPLNRKRFAADTPTDEEARAAIAGYVGYYAALTVYPGMVFHHRLALLGNGSADTLKRFVEFVGDEVHLTFPPSQVQGQESVTHVTLRRLSGEADMLGTR